MNKKFLKKIFNITSKILVIIICVLLSLIIILNISLWVHQKLEKNQSKIFGIYPLIVESNSMYPIFSKGDLIFSKPIKPGEIVEGDIISFENIYSPEKKIITHRINKIFYEDGIKKFTTKGDSNNFVDEFTLDSNYILGKYVGVIPKLGGFIELVRQPLTLILIFVVIILAYLLIYIMQQIKNHNRKKLLRNNRYKSGV